MSEPMRSSPNERTRHRFREAIKRWLTGIQGQLALYLLGFVALMTVVNLLVSGYLFRHYFAPSLDRDARTRVATLASRTSQSLRDRGVPLTDEEVSGALDGVEAVAVVLYGPDGAPLRSYQSDAPLEATAIPRWSVLTDVARFHVRDDAGGGRWRYFTPVPLADAPTPAVLQVDVSIARFDHVTEHNVLVHGAMLVVLMLGGLAVSIAAARRVTRPIRRLAEHARMASTTTPTTPITASGSVEMQMLGETFNSTLTSLRSSVSRLRQSERRFRKLFEAMPDIALELDAEGNILSVNAAVTRLGFQPGELEGKSISVLVADDEREHVRRALAQAPRASGLPEMNVRLQTRDGEPRFGELRAAPEFGSPDNSEGELRVVAIIRDVTGRRRAEEQAAQAQRVVSIQTLAAGISHEFNNVMATILGMGSLLADRADLPEDIRKELRRIIDTGRRGADLARRLLAHTHRTTAPLRSCDPCMVTEETVEILSRTLDKRVELRAEYTSGIPLVKGDPTELQQMLLNLGINAGDAMPDGGALSFSVSRLSVESHRDAQRRGVEPGAYVRVVVNDTGMGMDEAVQRRIFEPYFTTKLAGLGTGLGLSGVYSGVTGVGGGISVDSAPGEGARFELLLPVSEGDEAAVVVRDEAPIPPPEDEATAPTGTILVVDDERDLLEVTDAILRRAHHEPLLASDGFQAEELLREHGDAVDLVLLDVNMPMRDGVETFRALRALFPRLKVIVVSAGGLTDRRIADILEWGAVDVLPKPYEYQDLLKIVARWLAPRN